MKKIIPIGDRVVVEPIVETRNAIEGIVLPESMKKSVPSGKVIAVGKRFDPRTHVQIENEVKIGDTVLLPDDMKLGEVVVKKDDGTEVKQLIYRETDILGVVANA